MSSSNEGRVRLAIFARKSSVDLLTEALRGFTSITCQVFPDLNSLIRAASRKEFDCLIIGKVLPDYERHSEELAHYVKQFHPDCKIAVVSSFLEVETVDSAKYGVLDGYFDKSNADEDGLARWLYKFIYPKKETVSIAPVPPQEEEI